MGRRHSILAASDTPQIFALAFLFALLVASLAIIVAKLRVLARQHYTHDVLAGLALGVLVVGLAWALYRTIAPHLGCGVLVLPGSGSDAGISPGI